MPPEGQAVDGPYLSTGGPSAVNDAGLEPVIPGECNRVGPGWPQGHAGDIAGVDVAGGGSCGGSETYVLVAAEVHAEGEELFPLLGMAAHCGIVPGIAQPQG